MIQKTNTSTRENGSTSFPGRGVQYEEDGETVMHQGNFFFGKFIGDEDVAEFAAQEVAKRQEVS